MNKWFCFCIISAGIISLQIQIFADSKVDISPAQGEPGISGAYSSDSNTVLLLHMNESSWNGATNEVIDSSSYGNHGTAQNGATTIADGKYGRAGIFNGGDGVMAGYVNVADNDSLEIGTGDFTIEAWVKVDSLFGYGFIVTKGGGYNTGNPGYRWAITANGRFLVSLSSAYQANAIYNGYIGAVGAVTVGKWYHLALVIDRDRDIKIYVNGVQSGDGVDISAYSADDIYSTPTALIIGYSRKETFDGTIDEIRISNKARSLSEMNTSGACFPSSTVTSR